MNMCNDDRGKCIHDRINDIVCHLTITSNVLENFSKLSTNLKQINYAYYVLKDRNLLLKNCKLRKNNDEAFNLRKLGNEYFKKKSYGCALKFYTKSAFYAEDLSDNLAIAYANRSAVLFENYRYKECLIDITNAERNNYPNELKEKLSTRRSKAESLASTQNIDEYHCKIPTIETYSRNIECAANCLEIKCTTEYGRHVTSNRRINIGEVVAIEKPFAHILRQENAYTHCHNCLKYSYNLLPCNSCVRVGFCCEECRESAWDYHKIECAIIDTLYERNFNKLVLVALKIVLITRNVAKCNEHDANLYKSANYNEIYDLITNHELREPKELLQRCMIVAVVFDLLKTYTNFMEDEKQEATFKTLLLKHYEAASSNFHEITELTIKGDNSYEIVEIGSGAYSFLSLLNHSCTPNVVRHCYGKNIVLRALTPIEEGEQILDNYGYHHALMEKKDRLKYLKSQYLFDCRCTACLNDWPLYDPNSRENCQFDIDENVTKRLLIGDRNVAINELPRLIKIANELDTNEPSKSVLEIHEYIKQCYAVLANKRHLL